MVRCWHRSLHTWPSPSREATPTSVRLDVTPARDPRDWDRVSGNLRTRGTCRIDRSSRVSNAPWCKFGARQFELTMSV